MPLRPLLLLLLLFRNGDAGFPLRVQLELSERTRRPIPFHDDGLRCIMDAERTKERCWIDVPFVSLGNKRVVEGSLTLTRNNLASLNFFYVLFRLVKLKKHAKLDSLIK